VNFLHGDDAPVSIQCESVVVQASAGPQARMRTALLDVTARKQTEDTLRERERLFRILAQVAPVGIFHTDATGGCLYVNDQWCEIAGMRGN
jgi:PAS domain-containing protein